MDGVRGIKANEHVCTTRTLILRIQFLHSPDRPLIASIITALCLSYIVPQVFVMAASNLPWDLDVAVLRRYDTSLLLLLLLLPLLRLLLLLSQTYPLHVHITA